MKNGKIGVNSALIKARKLFETWNNALETKNPKKVSDLYSDDCTFLPTMSSKFKKGRDEAEEYFQHFLLKNPSGQIIEDSVQLFGKDYLIHSGLYDFQTDSQDRREIVRARFTFIWNTKNKKIVHHHSSVLPEK